MIICTEVDSILINQLSLFSLSLKWLSNLLLSLDFNFYDDYSVLQVKRRAKSMLLKNSDYSTKRNEFQFTLTLKIYILVSSSDAWFHLWCLCSNGWSSFNWCWLVWARYSWQRSIHDFENYSIDTLCIIIGSIMVHSNSFLFSFV